MKKKEIKQKNRLVPILLVILVIIFLIFLSSILKKNVNPAEQVNAKEPNSAELIGQAYGFYNSANYADAIRLYEKVIQAEPQNYAANIYLGYSYINLGIYDNALEIFQKTLTFKYFDYRSFYGLGLAYYNMEDYNSAYTYLKEAYKLNPSDKAAVSYLINTYNALGLYDEAINLSSENIKKNPNNNHYYRKIAIAYFLKKDFEKALENAKKSVELDNSYASNHLVFGAIYMGIGNNQNALSEFKQALSSAQSNAAYEGLAVTYSLLADSENSDINSKSAELQYKHSFTTSMIGFALLNLKQFDKAVKEFNSSIISNPNYYLPYKGISEAYIALGQKDKAIENLEKAWKLNNLDKETKQLLEKAKVRVT